MDNPILQDLTTSELKTLLRNLGYSNIGYPKLLENRLINALSNPISSFPNITTRTKDYLRRFGLSLTSEQLSNICGEETILSFICSDKVFWISKILREFKQDIATLETYPVNELREIYDEAINNRDENFLEKIKNIHTSTTLTFLHRNLRLKRAGIVPMIRRNKYTFYGFGLDQSSGDINEFAGKREKIDSDMLEAALREFNEETLGVFNITRRLIEDQDSEVLFDSQSCLFFVEIEDKNMMKIVDEFNQKIKEMKKKRIKIENGLLFWITEEQLRALLAIQRPNRDTRFPVFFHYPSRRLLTYKFGNINNCK